MFGIIKSVGTSISLKESIDKMIKEEYKQLPIHRQIGRIYAIVLIPPIQWYKNNNYTHTL